MKRLRIMIMIPNLGRGGAQKVFHGQLLNLTRDFDVFGCVFNWDDAFDSDHDPRIVSLEIPAGNNVFTKVYYFVRRIWKSKLLKRKYRIDVSISHLEGADYVNILSGYSKNVCWIHGSKVFDQNISGILGVIRHQFLMPFVYKRSDAIVTVSRGIAHEMANYLKGTKITPQVIYNGLDIKELLRKGDEQVDPEFFYLAETNKLIMNHCRLSAQKNLIPLIEIYKEVRVSDKVKLVLIGDGELRDHLSATSEKLGLKVWKSWDGKPMGHDFDVYLMGQQVNPFKYLKYASVFALTSLWEGFPLSLCEAIALNVPVIVADCPTGPREIIGHDVSLPEPLVEPYVSKVGILMPIVVSGDKKMVSLWTSQILSMLRTRDQWAQLTPKTDFFDLHHYLRQTTDLLGSL